MPVADHTSRRLPSLMQVGGALLVALALAPFAPQELPELPGGRAAEGICEASAPEGLGGFRVRGELEALPGPEVLPPHRAEPPDGPGGADGSPHLGARPLAAFVPAAVGLREAAVQLALSRYVRPPPAMHLCASARVVLFPQQGPPQSV